MAGEIFAFTVSGTVYSDEGATAATSVVKLVVAGTAYSTTTEANGTYVLDSVATSTTGTPMHIWLNNDGGRSGAAVTRYQGSGNISGLDMYENRLIVRHEDGGSMRNIDIDACDKNTGAECTDSDLHFDESAGTLTVDSDWALFVWTNKTFAPGGTLTLSKGAASSSAGGDLKLATSSLLDMGTNALYVGGDWKNFGDGALGISSGNAVTFTGTSNGFVIDTGNGSQGFPGIIFAGLANASSSWSFATGTTISEDLTISTGTITGVSNLTVNGGDVTGNGDINLTGGTFLLDNSGTFGGATAWDFSSLTLGDGAGSATTSATSSGGVTVSGALTVASGTNFLAGGKTWILSGAGSPFVISGAFAPETSTFRYAGAGATTIARATYHHLQFQPGSGSPAYTFAGGGPLTVNGDLTFGDGTNAVSVTASANDPLITVLGDYIVNAAASSTASDSATTTVAGSWLINSGAGFLSSGGTVVLNGAASGKTIVTGGTGTGKDFANLILNGPGGWTVTSTDLTATGTLNVQNIASLVINPGRIIEVRGAYSVCDTCSSSTTWVNATLFLNSGTSYTIGSKNQNAETYGTLSIATSTDIRLWKSDAATTTVNSAGSLYSQDHANSTGTLNIYGDYHVASGTTDYWRYDTDFDGAALSTSSQRRVLVRIETGSARGVTVDDGGALDVKGGGGGADQNADIDRIGSSGAYQLINNGTSTIFETKMANGDFAGGTWTLTNTIASTTNVTAGTLHADWYLGMHVVDKDASSTNIDTPDADIVISEVSGSSTVFKYSGNSWGSGTSSAAIGSNSSGHIAGPNTANSIRIREYAKTNTATTTYKYNVAIAAQSDYQAYNYFTQQGNNYITSNSSTDASGVDKVLGASWYRDTITAENPHPPALNDPPSSGTLLASMISSVLPVISSVSASGTTSTISVSWITDKLSSSKIEFGFSSSSYGASTTEADTSPRVASHVMTLGGLIPCAAYHFRIHSRDVDANEGIGSDNAIATAGCTGSSSVVSTSKGQITQSAGGALSLGSKVTLNVPSGFAANDANFQIKELASSAVLASAPAPSGKALAGSHIYDFLALQNVTTTIAAFLGPVTATIAYIDSDVSGLNESTLRIYRYNGSSWAELSNCSVNSSANSITCATTQFSTFAMFGDLASSGGGGGGGGGSGATYIPPVTPSGGFKVVINNGALTADTSTVALAFIAGPDTKFAQYSEDPAFSASSSELKNYEATATYVYVFSPQAGLKTIYARFYTYFLTTPSPVVSDTITLAYGSEPVSIPSGGDAAAAPASPSVFIFRQNLSSGMIHSDVKELQKFLNTYGFTLAAAGPGSPGEETEKFGAFTRAALQKYQCKFLFLCSGSPETNGWGVLGPRTKARINGFLKELNSRSSVSAATTTAPSVRSLKEQIKKLLLEVQALKRLLETQP